MINISKMELVKAKVAAMQNKVGSKEMVSGDNPNVIKRSPSALEPINSEGEKILQHKQIHSSSFNQEKQQLVMISQKDLSKQNFELKESMPKNYNKELMKRTNTSNEFGVQMNQLILQAALGSCRWPPYLLVLWVVILVLSHVMHCLLTLLTHALPLLKQVCNFFRLLTEESWLDTTQKHRKLITSALAFATVLVYASYLALYTAYITAVWFLQPLDKAEPSIDVECVDETKHGVTVTNYDEIVKV